MTEQRQHLTTEDFAEREPAERTTFDRQDTGRQDTDQQTAVHHDDVDGNERFGQEPDAYGKSGSHEEPGTYDDPATRDESTAHDATGYQEQAAGYQQEAGYQEQADDERTPADRTAYEAQTAYEEQTEHDEQAHQESADAESAVRDGDEHDERPGGPVELAEVSRTAGDAPLFTTDDAADYQAEWRALQADFVDDPREAVQRADELVAQVMQSLATTFTQHKHALEEQWQRGDEVQTEELRQALKRYRSFFDRLLSV
ncbi:hypothetical protein AB0G02_26215 [Actinosynnema sp. NPDC023658]|uniref:hypothetical protein n=1 Tax=Actinosynnema sp. NPDC023658 TaxID=3155465 RepID=UPI0033F3550A